MAVKAVFEGCEKDVHVAVCVVGAVQNLTYQMESHNVILNWDAIEGVDEYEVYVNEMLAATVETTAYAFDVEAGLTTVMVKAVTENCYVLGASVEICFAEAVTGLEFVSNGVNNRFYWQWNNPADVERFNVVYNGNVLELLPSPTGSTSLLMTDMLIGENTICVTAQSVYGCDAETVCLSQNICASVDSLDYHFNGDLVTVTWFGDADAYEVVVDGAEPVIVETNTFMDTLMGSLTVQVMPVHEDCMSLIASCFIESVYNIAPEIRITDVHDGYISMAWTEVDYPWASAIAYNLYRDGELIAEHLNETTYNDTEMALNAQHCYAVQSVFEKGVSDLSEEACANYFAGVGEGDSKVAIFPNPTTDKVTIECEGMSLIEVYNIEGKLVQRIQVEGDAYQLDGLDNGIYTLRIHKGETVLVRKVVKM